MRPCLRLAYVGEPVGWARHQALGGLLLLALGLVRVFVTEWPAGADWRKADLQRHIVDVVL